MNSDAPTEDILRFLAQHQGRWSTHGDSKHMPTVQDAVPAGTPWPLQLVWMRQLLEEGLVQGCGCGCRGDWEVTNKGLQRVGLPRTQATIPRVVEGALQIEAPGSVRSADGNRVDVYATLRIDLNGDHHAVVGDVMPSSGTPTAPAG